MEALCLWRFVEGGEEAVGEVEARRLVEIKLSPLSSVPYSVGL